MGHYNIQLSQEPELIFHFTLLELLCSLAHHIYMYTLVNVHHTVIISLAHLQPYFQHTEAQQVTSMTQTYRTKLQHPDSSLRPPKGPGTTLHRLQHEIYFL